VNLLRIAINDVRVVLKDPMVLIWWLALPLAFVFLFGLINRERSHGTWLPVFKLDHHELTEVLIEQLRAKDYWVEIKTANELSRIGEWPRALVIPATFSEDVLNGRRVDLTVTQGRDNPEHAMAATMLVARALVKFNAAIASIDLIERGWTVETKDELVAELARAPQLTVETRQHFSLRPPPTGVSASLPSYLVMFVLMMTVMYGGITLVYERSEKRISRLLAAPVSGLEVFLGKMLARMLQPALQGGLLLAAGVLLFQVPLGDHPLALIPVVAALAFFCGSVGLLFGLVFRTEQQVYGFGILTATLLSALGGCWWPLEVAPATFKTIAQFMPTFWAVQGIQDVLSFGKSFVAVLPECGLLVGTGGVITAVAMKLFYRQ